MESWRLILFEDALVILSMGQITEVQFISDGGSLSTSGFLLGLISVNLRTGYELVVVYKGLAP
jgi:hypothetical protein